MMPFVLALVFALEVVARLVNAIGSTALNDFVRGQYLALACLPALADL